MKAVLVIDEMPITCLSCPFTLSHICEGSKQTIGEIMTDMKVRHESCPLRPLPEKLYVEVNQIEDVMPSEFDMDKLILKIRLDADKLCALGWNACLDEILGEKE